jgi:hypothetical protein
MSTENKSRHHDNKFLARDIRRRLAARHPLGTALRETLDSLSDADLIEVYFRNEQQGRAHAARGRAEQEAGS